MKKGIILAIVIFIILGAMGGVFLTISTTTVVDGGEYNANNYVSTGTGVDANIAVGGVGLKCQSFKFAYTDVRKSIMITNIQLPVKKTLNPSGTFDSDFGVVFYESQDIQNLNVRNPNSIGFKATKMSMLKETFSWIPIDIQDLYLHQDFVWWTCIYLVAPTGTTNHKYSVEWATDIDGQYTSTVPLDTIYTKSSTTTNMGMKLFGSVSDVAEGVRGAFDMYFVTGQTIEFDADVVGGTPPYTYNWDFGDGSSGTGQVVQHTYSVIIYANVKLTITDSKGTIGTVGKSIWTNPLYLTLKSWPHFVIVPEDRQQDYLRIHFQAQVSGHQNQPKFDWDFGDGTTKSNIYDQTVEHVYESEGTYEVKVTAWDGAVRKIKASQSLVVVENPTVSIDVMVVDSDTMTIQAKAVILGGIPPYTYRWGIQEAVIKEGCTVGSVVEWTCVFVHGGTYIIDLTITDKNGFQASAQRTVYLEPSPPEPSVSADFNYDIDIRLVEFESNVKGFNKPSYLWDFGDGKISNSVHPSHIYDEYGTYTVKLTVSDGTNQKIVEKTFTLSKKQAFPIGIVIDIVLTISGISILGLGLYLRRISVIVVGIAIFVILGLILAGIIPLPM